jgi:electron transport complex protein RnfC
VLVKVTEGSPATSLPLHRTFARGVHPPEGKELAQEQAIEVLPVPDTVQVPVLQHLGAPGEPVVKARAEVEVGDLLVEAKGFVSASSHASVRGKVTRFRVTTLPNGRHIAVIPIKTEGEQPAADGIKNEFLFPDCPTEGLESHAPEDVVEAVKSAGIVGMGGAAFPTHVKLTYNEEKPIDTLLVNGAECEPYLTADYRLMLEGPRAIVAGAILAARAVKAPRIAIAVENNKPRAIESLREAAASTPVEVLELETKYPQGGEKQLIPAVLGREVPTGGLPLDVGVVVVNVGTASSIARAVLQKKPMTHRVIAVTGSGIRQPKNLLVPLGASYRHLIDFCGGITDEAERILAGGPMMGFTLGSLDVPVTKGTSGVTVLTAREIRRAEETTCVRCGRCVDVCPLKLVPTKIAMAARAGAWDVAERYYISACMECGCCAYECPASIPLVQLIRMGKAHLAATKRK